METSKATGIVRRIDGLGRIVVPMELRRALQINDGDPVEIFTGDDGEIILRRWRIGCALCGDESDQWRDFRGKRVCGKCRTELARGR